MPATATLATTEFLVVDTETNGLSGDACELTEIGAVLVGGGELHDRWESLIGVRAPLSRGIQRFTGITQAMVDEAPAAGLVLAELAELARGRVLVAHNAGFDRRVLRQACEREGIVWPDPPSLCTVALARRLHPLGRQRRLAPLAESLGIEVGVTHRALADAETCARVFCALFPKLCANAATVADARALLGPARRRTPRAGATDGAPRAARGGCVRVRRPDFSGLTDDPGVYVFGLRADGPLLSPCLGDLDPNLYRRRLDEALALFTGEGDGGTALLAHVDAEMRAAARAQRYERAAWLRRRHGRLRVVLDRLGGALAATHARPRLVLAEHPQGGGRFDAFWLVAGRVADWGPLGSAEDAVARTRAALRAGDGRERVGWLAPDEVDEVRIATTHLASRELPTLTLRAGAGGEGQVAEFVERVTAAVRAPAR